MFADSCLTLIQRCKHENVVLAGVMVFYAILKNPHEIVKIQHLVYTT